MYEESVLIHFHTRSINNIIIKSLSTEFKRNIPKDMVKIVNLFNPERVFMTSQILIGFHNFLF